MAMNEKAQAEQAYEDAVANWEQARDAYVAEEEKLAQAEYNNSSEVDLDALRDSVREKKRLADEALNKEIDATTTLAAFMND